VSEPNLSGGVEINPSSLKHPTLSFLRAWWDEKRAGRPVPSRSDIRPADFKQHLSWLMTLDVLESGRDFRYRIVGDDVAEYFFWNPSGKTVTEAFATQPAALTNVVMAIYRSVVDQKTPVYAFGETGWAIKNIERCEALHLPLSDNGECVDTILSAFVFNRREVRISREIARANDGQLIERPGA
jgi:hypothetical protein